MYIHGDLYIHQPLLHHLLCSADILILFATSSAIFLLTNSLSHSLLLFFSLLASLYLNYQFHQHRSVSFPSNTKSSILVNPSRAMMNLISFETPPPLARQESSAASFKVAKEGSSSGTCFHGSHLDLSLGISLSPGGRCGSADCGHRGGSDVGRMQSSDMLASTAIANTLSVGHGGNLHGIVSSSSWTAAFMPSPTGFMHPWSLAARQQKAAAEQDRRLAPPRASDASVVSLPSPAVGWPPVHTSRRQLVTATHTPKPNADEQKDAKMDATLDDKDVAAASRSCALTVDPLRRPAVNMFAKVHMDGCLIGRKINLRAHRSYDSLSQALNKMTRNFFCPADYSTSFFGEKEDCATSEDFIFLYEDFEGDRMLVGDVPWELFLASAKKLYIARHQTSKDRKGHDTTTKFDAIEKL